MKKPKSDVAAKPKLKVALEDNERRMWAICERDVLYESVVIYRPLFSTLGDTQKQCLKKYSELTGRHKIEPGYEMRYFRLTLEFQSRTRTKEQQAAYEARKKRELEDAQKANGSGSVADVSLKRGVGQG